MSDTARWALPLLEAGQAQKEMTVNEALAALDLLAGASVAAVGTDTPPAAPVAGQCWILGTDPTGDWTGHAQALAGWTAGGWRFLAPREGLTVWSAADGGFATFSGGAWRIGARQAGIAAPVGGAVVDAEARTAVAAVIAALVAHGLIAA